MVVEFASNDLNVEWPPDLIERAWDVCCCVLDLRTCKILEQKLRKGTGTEHWCEVNSCACKNESDDHECANHCAQHKDVRRKTLSTYCFSKTPDDALGQLLQQATTKKFFIEDHMPAVFEQAAQIFEKVVERKIADDSANRPAGEQNVSAFKSAAERASLQSACLISSIERTILSHVLSERVKSKQLDVKDGGRLAYPQSYKMMFPKSPYLSLQSIPADNMSEIMEQNWTIIPEWMEREDVWTMGSAKQPRQKVRDALVKDVEWLDMHNLFEDQTPICPDPQRCDSALWINAGDILPELQGLACLSFRLTSLPFEMNEKTQAKLTINNNLLVCKYRPGAFHKLHQDNCLSQDNGRTLTFIYSVHDDFKLMLKCEEAPEKQVRLKKDSLLVLKSRSVKYAIPAMKGETRALVFYWCHGNNNIQ